MALVMISSGVSRSNPPEVLFYSDIDAFLVRLTGEFNPDQMKMIREWYDRGNLNEWLQAGAKLLILTQDDTKLSTYVTISIPRSVLQTKSPIIMRN